VAIDSRRAHHQVTFAVLALGVAAFALLQSLVIPVLTTIQHELHTTQGATTWVLTAYLLSASIMTPILGRVGDMIGKERVFVATLIALAAGSLLAAVAPSIGVMIVARVVLAEVRAATPLIDMKMMRRTAVWTNNLVALLIGGGNVRDIRLPARVRADAVGRRLWLRGQHHALRADAPALIDHDVRRGNVRGPARPAARRQGPGDLRVPRSAARPWRSSLSRTRR
jgi:MFS family permease